MAPKSKKKAPAPPKAETKAKAFKAKKAELKAFHSHTHTHKRSTCHLPKAQDTVAPKAVQISLEEWPPEERSLATVPSSSSP